MKLLLINTIILVTSLLSGCVPETQQPKKAIVSDANKQPKETDTSTPNSSPSSTSTKSYVPPVDDSQLVTNVKYYWISTDGNNNNDCLTEATSCRSIQKGVSLAKAGETVLIKAGTYFEDSSKSPYTKQCGWFDPQIASICINSSGLPGKPITVRAAPGHERKVVIDNENSRLGLQIGAHDYLEFKGLKFINNREAAIANYAQTENEIPNENALSINVLIKGNIFINTIGEWGSNPAAIAMWNSKAWTVEDNIIDTVIQEGGRAAAGIQSYGVIEAVIKHNSIKNAFIGIFWKDHFIKDSARTLFQESEIAYNLIEASQSGILIGIKGQGTVEAGHNHIHHNLIKGLKPEGNGIVSHMSGARGVSGRLEINNNLIDGGGKSSTAGISVNSQLSTKLSSNLIFGVDVSLEFIQDAAGKSAKLMASDYNVFDENFKVIADRYSQSTSSKYFDQIADWQKATSANILSLKDLSSPDMNSKVLKKADVLNSDYTFKENSPALKMMNEKNPGPYENGNEQIGATFINSISTTEK